jgi:hypothetical protein
MDAGSVVAVSLGILFVTIIALIWKFGIRVFTWYARRYPGRDPQVQNATANARERAGWTSWRQLFVFRSPRRVEVQLPDEDVDIEQLPRRPHRRRWTPYISPLFLHRRSGHPENRSRHSSNTPLRTFRPHSPHTPGSMTALPPVPDRVFGYYNTHAVVGTQVSHCHC